MRELSHFLSVRWDTDSVCMTPSGRRADRILARPVQKIKAGQLALMLALLGGEWGREMACCSARCYSLFFPVCRNSCSSIGWTQNHVHNQSLVSHTGKISSPPEKQTSVWHKVILKDLMSCTTRVHVIQLMLLSKATDTHFNTIGDDYRRHFGLEYLAQGHFGHGQCRGWRSNY